MENKAPNLSELKRLLADCFAPNPWIYWSDFLFSAALAYGSFFLSEFLPLFSWMQPVAYAVSVLAFYRCILFIHELTHQDRKDLPFFSWAFNLLAGIPFLLPSFMYRGVHIDHHKKTSYGTAEDGEYLPLGAQPLSRTLAYIGQSFVLPFLVVLRFGILGPVSLTHPRLRQLVMERASALAIQTNAIRKIPKGEDLRNWYALEFLAFLYVLAMAYLFLSETLPLGTLAHMYVVFVGVALLNSVRTVVAHRYLNRSLQELSFQDQILDSVNIGGNSLIGELVAPVGLRYHALHHLFASIPYHNMGIAHRRLMNHLPEGSFYHQATEPNLWSALAAHWKNTQTQPELSAHAPQP